MSASDQAFYGAISRLSKRMISSDQPLTGLFDGMSPTTTNELPNKIDLLKVSETSRWSILHHGIHIVEVSPASYIRSLLI
jgi:hypothetical protein